MSGRKRANFLFGFILGGLLCLLLWYWQKSTSADEGALALLDRMARADARIRELQQRLSALVQTQADDAPAKSFTSDVEATGVEPVPDDLQRVKGVGPIFAGRLEAAGIATVAALKTADVEAVASALGVGLKRAQAIIAEARRVG